MQPPGWSKYVYSTESSGSCRIFDSNASFVSADFFSVKSILIFAFVVAPWCLRAQPSNLQKLNAFIDYIEHHNPVRGAFAIYKNGPPVYSRRFGVASDQVSKE